MAVIQKIRNKYGKLAGFVIALALVGFILMDAASGRFGEFFGRDASVAKVNGEKIDSKDYQQRIKEYETLYAYSARGKSIDEATRAQLNAQSLNELITEKLVKEEAEKIGLQTTKEEEKDLIYGASPDPIVQQYPAFANPDTRMFDPSRVKAFEQQIDQIDPSGKMRDEWEALKAYVLRNNLVRKYNALLSNAVYTPKFMIDRMMKEQSEFANIRFVNVPYTTVNDNEVKVTEDEMVAYMKKRAPLYTITEPTRSIEYVSFDVIPTAEDTARALGTLNQLKAEFATTPDAQSFVNRNSDDQYIDAFVNKGSFMSAYADSILSLPTGAIYGPYFENGEYKMTKVVEKRTLPDSVKSRHILVKTENARQPVLSDTLAKARIDSVAAAIKGGADFNAMVMKYSDDEGSKNTGGEYTFTLQQRGQLSKEFADFIFDGSEGQSKIVKVENDGYAGYHYIEILDQTGVKPAAKLAVVSKALYAGDNTENAAYAKATEFAGNNNNEKAFDEAVKKGGLNKRLGENVKANDFMIAGVGPAREIIRWVYDAKVGDVSPVFTLDNRYVVVKVSGKQDEGLMKLDATMKPVVEAAVKTEKKAKIIADKYKSQQSLDAIAQATQQPVTAADSFNASSPFVANIGYEPKVVGYSFYNGFKPNTVSPGIQGQAGVLFISLVNRFNKPVDTDPAIINQQKMMMNMQNKNAMSGALNEMLLKGATIKYNSKNL